jgi:predicted DNA-binding mobile mystery protein A
MQRSDLAKRTRAGLDHKFRTGLVKDLLVRPRSGWVRAVRTGLGMSQEALGERLGINKSSVNKLERNEATGAISVAKLQEVAAALGCRLVYALVPDTTLDDIVQSRAREVAATQLGYVGTTSALEAQEVDPDTRAEQLAEYAEGVIARNTLWRPE